MNRNNIFIEALYEFKCARRNILFCIFSMLGIVGLVLYQFTPLSGTDSVNTINDLFHFKTDWVSQSLPSSIAYKTAHYFNIIQLLFVVVFITNDLRISRLRAIEPLHTRPLNNSEIVIGNFLGKSLAFTMVNVITFTISMLINVIFHPQSFEMFLYFFYWITLTFPALVYFLGISYLVTRFARHQGLSMLILFAFLGTIVYWGADWFNGLPDPCARYIPNLFSDFTGHVNLENYLLQRSVILTAGVGFLALSVIPYPRIPNHFFSFKKSLSVACILFILAGVIALIYHFRHETISNNREIYKKVYNKHGTSLPARVVRNDLHLKELENGGISVNSQMTVSNQTENTIPLVIYLNPGLKVNSLQINGNTASFERDHQALVTGKELKPGEVCEVSIDYEGVIENDICFLNTDPEKYNSTEVNNLKIYHFGYSPAFCEKEYKLLTPECNWYPMCVQSVQDVNFSHYSLQVEHDPRLMAISQGNIIETKEGETMFSFDHDMPGISLCVGNYKKREITVDSIRLAIYCLPAHDYLLDKYNNISKEKFIEKIQFLKNINFESTECIRTTEFYNEKSSNKYSHDPTQEYPYRWLTILEVPCNFHCFPGIMQPTGERVQGGIAFIPEKAYSIKTYPFPESIEMDADEEEKAVYKLDEEIRMIMDEGSCSIKPLFRGKTMFISSHECPIMHDIFANVSHGYPNPNVATESGEYAAIEYLKNNSLKDALHDQSLSPELLESIIRKKSQELEIYISSRIRASRFRQFHVNFLKSNLFKEVTPEAYFQQFQQTFGFSLDSLVENWNTSNQLPLFVIQDARVQNIGETEPCNKLYRFKIFNNSNIPGFIKVNRLQGWIIPPRKAKEIRFCDMSPYHISMPLAQNLPSITEFEQEEPTHGQMDTTTGVFDIAPSLFLPNENEIIVDNEDPGFKTVKAKNFISSLFRNEKKLKEYGGSPSEEYWAPFIQENFYGFPVRSAFWKPTGSGKQKVEWNASLPQEGKYEVLFYYTRRFKNQKSSFGEEETRHYAIFDGKEEHEVITDINGDEIGIWISLGTFNFSKNSKVTLSDKGRTEGYAAQGIVADAVKWVRIKE